MLHKIFDKDIDEGNKRALTQTHSQRLAGRAHWEGGRERARVRAGEREPVAHI